MIDLVDLQDEIQHSRDERLNVPRIDCVRDLRSLARAEELCGLGLDVIDTSCSQFNSGVVRYLDSSAASMICEGLVRSPTTVIVDHHPELTLYGMRIPGTDLSAGGVLLKSDCPPPSFRDRLQRSGWSDPQWESWCHQHSGIRPVFARRLLTVTHLCMSLELMQGDLLSNNESLVNQLGSSYETMTLIGELPRSFKPSDPPFVMADTIIRRVQQICEADWSAYCLRHESTTWWQLHGSWGMSGDELADLLLGFQLGSEPKVIVKNVATCPQLRRNFPRVRSLVAVPLYVTESKPSWLILANPLRKAEMGTEEAHLLKAVGHLLVAQIQRTVVG